MTDKDEIFNDERILDLPPGYKTVKLQIKELEWIPGQIPVSDMFDKLQEIIKFINLTEITVTGNEEFLQKFKDWIV